MTITFRWWYLVIALVLIPIIYAMFRRPQSGWDMQIDSMLIAAVCWFAAIGIVIGHLLS